MSNMSYCRFRNTLADLRECLDWLSEHEPDELKDEERAAFRKLVNLCAQIADDYRDMP